MVSEDSLLLASMIVIAILIVMLWYKIFLHYNYLVKFKKVAGWKDFILTPFNYLDSIFILTLPFFVSHGYDKSVEQKIKYLIKIFWIIFGLYMMFLLIILLSI